MPRGISPVRREDESPADHAFDNRYQLLIANAPVCIHEIDLDGRLTYMNPAGLSMVDSKLERVCGCRYLDFVGEKDREMVRQLMGRAMLGEAAEFEFSFEFEDQVLTFSSNFIPIKNHRGEVEKLMGITQDLTVRKQAEVERERLIGELESKNADLERFVYTVSHELKTPLVTIAGFAGILAKDLHGGKTEKVEGHVDRITSAIATMNHLLDELLEMSRVGRADGSIEPVPLAEVIAEVIEDLDFQIADSRVDVRVAAELPVVLGNRLRLYEVMQNLLENAIKFRRREAASRIEIDSYSDEASAVCVVRDNGIGIDPEYRDRVFDLFERLDPRIPGTGVGLALARRIIESLGGSIWVDSQGSGTGSTFCLSFPLPK